MECRSDSIILLSCAWTRRKREPRAAGGAMTFGTKGDSNNQKSGCRASRSAGILPAALFFSLTTDVIPLVNYPWFYFPLWARWTRQDKAGQGRTRQDKENGVFC